MLPLQRQQIHYWRTTWETEPRHDYLLIDVVVGYLASQGIDNSYGSSWRERESTHDKVCGKSFPPGEKRPWKVKGRVEFAESEYADIQEVRKIRASNADGLAVKRHSLGLTAAMLQIGLSRGTFRHGNLSEQSYLRVGFRVLGLQR